MNSTLLSMQYMAARAQTPLQRFMYGLHPAVDYIIMPIFAFANAGIFLGGDIGPILTQPATFGTAIGLLIGNPWALSCRSG